MELKPLFLGSLFALPILVPCPLSATSNGDQFCDQGLRDLLTGARAYQPRDGNRCEGEYAQQVNSGLMEVKSFVMGPIGYDVGTPEELFVRWHRPLESQAATWLRGTSLRHDQYYRMDTAVAASRTDFEWSLDVLANLEVEPRHLGVAAWVAPETETRIFLPVAIGQGTVPELVGDLRLRLVANYEITTLFVTVRRARWPGRTDGGFEVVEEQPPDDFGFPAKQPIEVMIERPRQPGLYAVEIGFRYEDTAAAAGEIAATDTIYFFSGQSHHAASPETSR